MIGYNLKEKLMKFENDNLLSREDMLRKFSDVNPSLADAHLNSFERTGLLMPVYKVLSTRTVVASIDDLKDGEWLDITNQLYHDALDKGGNVFLVEKTIEKRKRVKKEWNLRNITKLVEGVTKKKKGHKQLGRFVYVFFEKAQLENCLALLKICITSINLIGLFNVKIVRERFHRDIAGKIEAALKEKFHYCKELRRNKRIKAEFEKLRKKKDKKGKEILKLLASEYRLGDEKTGTTIRNIVYKDYSYKRTGKELDELKLSSFGIAYKKTPAKKSQCKRPRQK